MRFTVDGKKVEASRVTSFTASRQRGKVVLIGKHMGRSADGTPIPARNVTIVLSKKYNVEFYQTDKHRLVIVVNGDAVWVDNPS